MEIWQNFNCTENKQYKHIAVYSFISHDMGMYGVGYCFIGTRACQSLHSINEQLHTFFYHLSEGVADKKNKYYEKRLFTKKHLYSVYYGAFDVLFAGLFG